MIERLDKLEEIFKDTIQQSKIMNYIAITEVSTVPAYEEPKEYTTKEWKEIFDKYYIKGFDPIGSFKETVPNYMIIKLSDETYKFILNVATISVPFFGEKEYKINDLKFTICTEEDYEKRFGKFNETNNTRI